MKKILLWIIGISVFLYFGFYLLGIYAVVTEDGNTEVSSEITDVTENNVIEEVIIEEAKEVKKNLVPETDSTCEELTPDTLIILRREIFPMDKNFLKNGEALGSIYRGHLYGNYCSWHAPAKPGEYAWVGGLFTCYGQSSGGGGTTSEGIVKQSYRITFEFNLDERDCTHLYDAAGGEVRECEIISSACNWEYTN